MHGHKGHGTVVGRQNVKHFFDNIIPIIDADQ